MLRLRLRKDQLVVFAVYCCMIAYATAVQALPWWAYVLPLLAWSGVLAYGAMRIEARFFVPSVCSGSTGRKAIALTFDDGPLPEYTPVVLDILAEAQAPAAFFCIGKNAEANPDLLQRIYEAGHVVGNHSYSHHFWFDMFGSTRMLTDMHQADDAVEAAIDHRPRLFRPPYGVTNPNLARAISRGGYVSVGWNIRSLDTVAKDENELKQRILDQLKPGAILLLHDTCAITAQLLPALITEIRARGYVIERLDKLINEAPYA